MPERFLIVCGGSGKSLIGKRHLLGLRAELQIDVTNELYPENVGDNSFRLGFDQSHTVHSLFHDFHRRRVNVNPGENQDYFSNTIPNNGNDSDHISFLQQYNVNQQPLTSGLAKSPAVGSLAIRLASMYNDLHQKLVAFFQCGVNLGIQNPPEIWIVSSTAGGTGEGTHRFVAATIITALRAHYGEEMSIKFHFIRVGSLTYRTIDQDSTSRNTFFGLAADAGFTRYTLDHKPFVQCMWYYIDLPDLGKDGQSKEDRAEMIEMACKAIMWQEMQNKFQVLFIVNDGNPFTLVRTGFWRGDFSTNQRYYQTLYELEVKLRALIQPASTDRYWVAIDGAEITPTWSEPDLVFLDQDYVTNQVVRGGWSFPNIDGARTEFNERLRQWIGSINRLLRENGRALDALEIFCQVQRRGRNQMGEEEMQPFRLTVNSVPFEIQPLRFNTAWKDALDQAHCASTWCRRLLEGPHGLRSRLESKARELVAIFHGLAAFTQSPSAKARQLMQGDLLLTFIKLLGQVNYLEERQRTARERLQNALAIPRILLEKVGKEKEIARIRIGELLEGAVRSVDLFEQLDLANQYSWLDLLTQSLEDDEQFKSAVLRGSTGLTKIGLCRVLGLNENASIEQIVNALISEGGKMRLRDGKVVESVWWQGIRVEVAPNQRFEVRIMPDMDRILREELANVINATRTNIQLVFSPLGLIELNVMSFEAAVLGGGPGDFLSGPRDLIKPMIPYIRKSLDDWPTQPDHGISCGRHEIAYAGPLLEPLYKDAIFDPAGELLTQKEIGQLEEYYKLYPPEQ